METEPYKAAPAGARATEVLELKDRAGESGGVPEALLGIGPQALEVSADSCAERGGNCGRRELQEDALDIQS